MDLRAASAGRRGMLSALMALALALRLLSPAGFMPSFAGGALTIVVCPDAGLHERTVGHHHDHGKTHQQPCPYAAAASAGSLPTDVSATRPAEAEPAALRPAIAVATIHRDRTRDRPPATGPPLLPA